jgi:uncharacterized protein (TIGR03790 family)
MTRSSILVAAFLGVVGLAAGAASALDASGVLVVYNSACPDGWEIAQHYAQVHPGVTTLGIDGVPVAEVVGESVYLEQIRPQVLAALDGSVDCIVTTMGMPLRIVNGHPGANLVTNVYSSLESELTRIDTINSATLMGNQTPPMPGLPASMTNANVMNPYLGKTAPFSHAAYGIRLAARLDGFTASDVIAAIDRSRRAEYGDAWFVVDDDPDITYDRMPQLANVLTSAGVNMVHDNTDAFVGDAPGGVICYVSHGRYGGAPEGYILDDVNGLRFDISRGAIMATWESYNAYSFVEGGNRAGQGLLAEWIHRGGSAAVGTVEEPGATGVGVASESMVFDRMLNGMTWAEAAWGATTQLSYVNTVVGDPLMVWIERRLPGDANGDGKVGFQDIDLVLANWGCHVADGHLADLNMDGFVGQADLDIVLAHWGRTTN